MEQLQNHSSYDIQKIFNHYCLLSEREVPDGDELKCTIPVQVSGNKVLVDLLALSKRTNNNMHVSQWTQLYSPTRSNQIIGNAHACESLLQWLQSWKMKCDGSKAKKKTCSINFHSPLHLESDLLPAVMLHGPHGSGKTAAVYACAAESGFKVICYSYNMSL